jgi:hypothetical protein
MPVVKLSEINLTGGSAFPYITLKSGTNQIRFLSPDPYERYVHWINESQKTVPCVGKENCTYCNDGLKIQKKFCFAVIDRVKQAEQSNENEKTYVGVLEVGWKVLESLVAFHTDEDLGDITEYDIKIKKTGEGTNTVYTCIPGTKKTKLTNEEKLKVVEIFGDLKNISETLGDLYEGRAEDKGDKSKTIKKDEDIVEDQIEEVDIADDDLPF